MLHFFMSVISEPNLADNPSANAMLHLEQRAFEAQTSQVLGFTAVNEALALVSFRQASFFTRTAQGRLKLVTASGLVSVAEDSPYAIWLSRFAQSLPTPPGCQRLDFENAPAEFVDGWEEWLPEHLLSGSIFDAEGLAVGLALYARETPWLDGDMALLDRAHLSYGHCLGSLQRKPRHFGASFGSLFRGRFSKWLVLAAALPLMAHLPPGTATWLVAGGLAYSGGVVFFVLDSKLVYAHAVWHCFVVAGTGCHVFAVLDYAA